MDRPGRRRRCIQLFCHHSTSLVLRVGIPSYSIAKLKPIFLRPERDRLSPRRMLQTCLREITSTIFRRLVGSTPISRQGLSPVYDRSGGVNVRDDKQRSHRAMTCSRESNRRTGRKKPNSNACPRGFTLRSKACRRIGGCRQWEGQTAADLGGVQGQVRDKEEALNRGFAARRRCSEGRSWMMNLLMQRICFQGSPNRCNRVLVSTITASSIHAAREPPIPVERGSRSPKAQHSDSDVLARTCTARNSAWTSPVRVWIALSAFFKGICQPPNCI